MSWNYTLSYIKPQANSVESDLQSSCYEPSLVFRTTIFEVFVIGKEHSLVANQTAGTHQSSILLTLSTLGKISSRRHIEVVFLISPENRIWRFMHFFFSNGKLINWYMVLRQSLNVAPGSLQNFSLSLVLKWTDFYRISELLLQTLIQLYDEKSVHFWSSSKKRDYLKFYRLSDATFYDRTNIIYQFMCVVFKHTIFEVFVIGKEHSLVVNQTAGMHISHLFL